MSSRNNPGDEPTSIQPMPEPGEDPVATLLADVLTAEARQIEPTDRLAAIRTAAGTRRRRAWVPVAAGAAAVVLIGGGAWAVVERNAPGKGTSAASPGPTRQPSATPTPSATSSTPAGVPVTVPVYYLGKDVQGLFREFQRATVRQDTPVEAMNQALRLAVNPTSPSRPSDSSPWLRGTSDQLVVTFDGKQLVTVSVPVTEQKAAGRTREQARLAAQQLVWTVTAAMQRPDVRVQIVFGAAARASAGSQPTAKDGLLFGSLPTAKPFFRPTAALSYTDLSAIWVLKPEPGSTAASSVVVSGQACTFEGSVAWQLIRSGTVVRSGHLTASSGCPGRGTWSVPLKGLGAGGYTFRAYSLSPMDGKSYEGLDTTTFTVR
jgi:Immunoglobulin-like domain of bacterial spore germination